MKRFSLLTLTTMALVFLGCCVAFEQRGGPGKDAERATRRNLEYVFVDTATRMCSRVPCMVPIAVSRKF